MNRFSNFAETKALPGDRIKIDAILNKMIIVSGARISNSKYSKNATGKYLTLQYKLKESEKLYIVFTGSDVLISQIEEHMKQIPFETKIVKINRYYTFS